MTTRHPNFMPDPPNVGRQPRDLTTRHPNRPPRKWLEQWLYNTGVSLPGEVRRTADRLLGDLANEGYCIVAPGRGVLPDGTHVTLEVDNVDDYGDGRGTCWTLMAWAVPVDNPAEETCE